MCCFSGPVERVSETQIFARGEGTTQLLAYSMLFRANADVAMILPLPVPPGSAEEALRFIDLSGYPDFFAHLGAAFPPILEMTRGGPPQPRLLRVHDVGSFEASFVPTRADFARLDPRFRLPDSAWDRLPQYADYGFAVFKLRPSEAPKTIHPMAFQFPRRDPSLLFFPAVHVHDGVVHDDARFDHTLFMQGPPVASFEQTRTSVRSVINIPRAQGLVDGDGRLGRRVLKGLYPNRDIVVSA